MSLLDILLKAGGAAASLVTLLGKVKEVAPDLAGEVDAILDKLAATVAPDNLIALAECLPKELANIAAGKLDPRRHSSDVA
jgi:hypothetical protein